MICYPKAVPKRIHVWKILKPICDLIRERSPICVNFPAVPKLSPMLAIGQNIKTEPILMKSPIFAKSPVVSKSIPTPLH